MVITPILMSPVELPERSPDPIDSIHKSYTFHNSVLTSSSYILYLATNLVCYTYTSYRSNSSHYCDTHVTGNSKLQVKHILITTMPHVVSHEQSFIKKKVVAFVSAS